MLSSIENRLPLKDHGQLSYENYYKSKSKLNYENSNSSL